METQKSLQQRLVDMAEEDEAFRTRLLDDPRTAIRESLDVDLPDDFSVVVHEEDARTAHLVLPPSSALTDAQLDQVTGGGAHIGWRP